MTGPIVTNSQAYYKDHLDGITTPIQVKFYQFHRDLSQVIDKEKWFRTCRTVRQTLYITVTYFKFDLQKSWFTMQIEFTIHFFENRDPYVLRQTYALVEFTTKFLLVSIIIFHVVNNI